jgi:hypothetical protein
VGVGGGWTYVIDFRVGGGVGELEEHDVDDRHGYVVYVLSW